MTYIDDPSLTPAENASAAVAERGRFFAAAHFAPPQPPVPDVPLARYDVCTCDQPRLMHGPGDHAFVLAEKADLSWLSDPTPEVTR